MPVNEEQCSIFLVVSLEGLMGPEFISVAIS
jgi:hypothetical protein